MDVYELQSYSLCLVGWRAGMKGEWLHPYNWLINTDSQNIRGNNILETEHLPFYSGCEDMEAREVICPQWDVSGLSYRTYLTIPCCVFDSLPNSTSRPGAVSPLSLSWEYQCHQYHWCGSDCQMSIQVYTHSFFLGFKSLMLMARLPCSWRSCEWVLANDL